MGKHGGARLGAGRPKKTDIAKGEVVAQKLQTAFQVGLEEIGTSLPELIRASVDSALSEAKDAGADRRFLIKLFSEMVKITEDDKTPYAQLMQQWVQQVNVNVDREGDRRTEVIESGVIPGANGRTVSP